MGAGVRFDIFYIRAKIKIRSHTNQKEEPFMEEKMPQMGRMGPKWWHSHGTKMKLITTGICNEFFILQGSAAELIVTRKRTLWLVSWKVIQSPDEQTIGQVLFSNDDLLVAFGFSGYNFHPGSEWLIEQYGGTVARQGKYIRYKNFLNIPCPGTGNDGDPNISIELGEEIMKAAVQLVYHCR